MERVVSMVSKNIDARDTILCIGPGRSGSTYLYDCLRFAFNITELDVKEKNILLGEKKSKYNSDVIIDVSNTLYSHPRLLSITQDFLLHNPNTELLLINREPRERLNSLYKYQIQAGLVRDEQEFWDKLLKHDIYFVHKNSDIRELLNLGILKIVSFDELRSGMCKIDLFGKSVKLSADDGFKNTARQPRFKFIMKTSRSVFNIFQETLGKNIAHKLKRNHTLLKILYRGISTEKLSTIPPEAQKLIEKEKLFFENVT